VGVGVASCGVVQESDFDFSPFRVLRRILIDYLEVDAGMK
jgi:hypothetical protein